MVRSPTEVDRPRLRKEAADCSLPYSGRILERRSNDPRDPGDTRTRFLHIRDDRLTGQREREEWFCSASCSPDGFEPAKRSKLVYFRSIR